MTWQQLRGKCQPKAQAEISGLLTCNSCRMRAHRSRQRSNAGAESGIHDFKVDLDPGLPKRLGQAWESVLVCSGVDSILG